MTAKAFKLLGTTLKRFSLYVEKHNLLIKYRERKRGVFRTLLAWGFVGYTAITFRYALAATSIPGPIALLLQSIAILSFPLTKCLFDDGLSCLKVTERISFAPEHLSVLQRRWSIFIRSTLGILSGVCFEYSKAFSSIVDNSALYGADAVVVAFFMRVVLKQKIGKRWIWIGIAFLGIITVIYTDFQSLHWIRSAIGALFGILSVVLLAIVLLMTSYMVHNDKPITIVFYQSLAAVLYASLYLLGSIIYLFLNKDYDGIRYYLSYFNSVNLTSFPILALCSGGFLYGWALLLFFQSLYYTELLILAMLGYFLSPIMAGFEWLIYHTPLSLKDAFNTLCISVGTGGLYFYEKMNKEREEIYLVPTADSLQENLYSTILGYKDGKLSKYYYLTLMYEFEKLIDSFPDLIKNTTINTILINKNGVFFEIATPKIIIEDDSSFRCPTFEILNFGEYEPEVSELLFALLQDGDTILEIGAGVGWYSLGLSRRFPNSLIYSFEPIKDLFEILKNNIQLNAISNVQIFNSGIADFKGTKSFHYLRNQHEYLRSILQPIEQECPVDTLQQVVSSLKLSKIDFIKQELKVKEDVFLIHVEDIIEKFKPLIMFTLHEYWDRGHLEDFHKSIKALEIIGYKKIIINEKLKQNVTREKHYLFLHKDKHSNLTIPEQDIEHR